LKAYSADLVPGEPFIGTTAGNVCKDLRASDGIFELAAILGGGRILPDGRALEGEGGGRELVGEALVWVESRKKLFGLRGPVNGTVLL
jgi:hypothetical protein